MFRCLTCLSWDKTRSLGCYGEVPWCLYISQLGSAPARWRTWRFLPRFQKTLVCTSDKIAPAQALCLNFSLFSGSAQLKVCWDREFCLLDVKNTENQNAEHTARRSIPAVQKEGSRQVVARAGGDSHCWGMRLSSSYEDIFAAVGVQVGWMWGVTPGYCYECCIWSCKREFPYSFVLPGLY